MILFKIIGTFFLFLICLLILLLIAPIKGKLNYATAHFHFEGHYLWGILKIILQNKKMQFRLFGFEIKSHQSSEQPTDITIEKNQQTHKKKTFKKPSFECLRLTLQLLMKLIRIIAPKQASCRLTLGIDEPYYIEMMHIASQMFFIPLNKRKNYHFEFIPVYDDVVIDYEGTFMVRFSLLSFILPILRYIIRQPIRDYFNIRLFKRKP